MEKKTQEIHEKPLGIKAILVLNSIPIFIVIFLTVVTVIIVRLPDDNIMKINLYNVIGGESAETVARMLGGIMASAIMPVITINMVLKKRYELTLACIIFRMLTCTTMCLDAFLAGIMLVILVSSGATKEYLKGHHKYRAKAVTQNKRQE